MNTLIFCFKILFYLLKLCHQLAKSTFSTVIILKNSYFPLCTWIFLSPYIYHWSKQTICIIEHIYEYFSITKNHLGLNKYYIIQTTGVFCNIVGFFCYF